MLTLAPCTSFAQENPTSNPDPTPTAEQPETEKTGDPKDKKSTAEKITKNTAETAAEALKPNIDPTNNPKLAHAIALAKKARATHQASLQKIATPEFITEQKALLQQRTEQVAQIKDLITQLNNASGNKQRDQLQEKIRTALQPIGAYLASADYQLISTADITLTPAQITELKTTQKSANTTLKINPNIPPEDVPTLELLTPQFTYTLTHLPVPITIKSAPDTTIYLTTGTGGQFPNQLPAQKITTNKQGIARTHWLTHGDASGICSILASSPNAVNRLSIDIDTVKPTLYPLSNLPAPKTP